jgi:predicted dehydrogenase
VGGVGTGRIFQWAHLRPYPQLWRKARLVAFYDLNPDRAREARDKYAGLLEEYAHEHPEAAEYVQQNLAELTCCDTLDEILDCVDVVDVCTHSRGRMAVAMAAFEKGVHCMVEKPMARTWIEADRAARACADHPDVLFQLNDDNAFDPKYHAYRDLVRQGAVGKVQHVTLIRGSGTDATTVLKSQASALDNGGGCLMDYGSHGIAGVWSVLGLNMRPVRVEAVKIGVRFPHRVLEGEPVRLEVEDDAHVKILFEDPETGEWVTVFLEATWSGGEIGLDERKSGAQAGGYVRIEGDEGVIESTDKTSIRVLHWDGGESVIPLREYPGETISVLEEVEAFIDAVRGEREPVLDINFGAEVIATCGAAYLSALRNRPVTLEEFREFSRGYVDEYGDNERAEEALLKDLLEPYARRD